MLFLSVSGSSWRIAGYTTVPLLSVAGVAISNLSSPRGYATLFEPLSSCSLASLPNHSRGVTRIFRDRRLLMYHNCGLWPQHSRGVRVWGHAPPEKYLNLTPSESDFRVLSDTLKLQFHSDLGLPLSRFEPRAQLKCGNDRHFAVMVVDCVRAEGGQYAPRQNAGSQLPPLPLW